MPCGCESNSNAIITIIVVGVILGLGYVIVRFLKNYKEEVM